MCISWFANEMFSRVFTLFHLAFLFTGRFR